MSKERLERAQAQRTHNSAQIPMNRRAFVRGLAGLVASLPACAYGQPQRSGYLPWGRWEVIPSIVVVSAADDRRLSAVREAVDFWNAELSRLGSAFRLGAITHIVGMIPFHDIHAIKLALKERNPVVWPDSIRLVDGDVIVALSDGTIFFDQAFTSRGPARKQVFVAIPGMPASRSLSNLARNVVAHELGHVIGLRHNNNPKALMCGNVTCPLGFPAEGFLPLTMQEEVELLEMYPSSWQAGPSRRWKADPPAGATPG